MIFGPTPWPGHWVSGASVAEGAAVVASCGD